MEELPKPWNTAAEQAGVRQTYRGIGDAAGLSHVTVRRLIAEGRTSPKTIAKVADALHVDESLIYQWANVPVSEWGPWTPPREAHQMGPRTRAAVEELIRAITEERGSDAGNITKKSPGPSESGMTQEDVDLAARTVKGDRTRQREQQWDDLGTESQDDGGMEPV